MGKYTEWCPVLKRAHHLMAYACTLLVTLPPGWQHTDTSLLNMGVALRDT
jgi:hypothetical protein